MTTLSTRILQMISKTRSRRGPAMDLSSHEKQNSLKRGVIKRWQEKNSEQEVFPFTEPLRELNCQIDGYEQTGR